MRTLVEIAGFAALSGANVVSYLLGGGTVRLQVKWPNVTVHIQVKIRVVRRDN